ncbi:MAG: type II toxin-antitoxin system RelE/ParE family toxin [Blautia sp.]|nr:type II toxin-antitoxin system RelE/ParE family toxin [Blautia sp.]
MSYNLHITKMAEDDLNAAADYIEFTLFNPQAADDLLDKAEKELSSLTEMPQIHRLVDDPFLKVLGIRFILVNNFMAFFLINEKEETVYIIRFLYEKRNWIQILKDEPISLV